MKLDKLAAVVLAGGQGTRMKSRLPKAAHLLLGRPLAAWPVRLAQKVGAHPLVVVVGERGGPVERTTSASFPAGRLRFALQDQPRGTADAVVAGREATEGAEHVLILNGDVPLIRKDTIERLVEAYVESGEALALLSCVLDDGGSYGRVLRDDVGAVTAIREARDANPEEKAVTEVNVGVYLARRELLYEGLSRLDSDNAQGEFYLTDLVEILRADGHRVAGVPLDDAVEMQGVNTRAELAMAGGELVARMVEGWTLDQSPVDEDTP